MVQARPRHLVQHGDAAPSDIERPRLTISGDAPRSGTTAVTAWNMQSYLARPDKPGNETSSRPTRPPVVYPERPIPIPNPSSSSPARHTSNSPRCYRGWVQVCVTSPPSYPPARRLYNMLADGTFHCPRPMTSAMSQPGKAASTMLCDAISVHSSACCGRMALCSLCSTMSSQIPPASTMSRPITEQDHVKLSSQAGFRSQDTHTFPKRQWSGLPFRFAMAMMDDGRFWRDHNLGQGQFGPQKSTIPGAGTTSNTS